MNVLLTFFLLIPTFAFAQSAEEILKRADAIRSPTGSYKMIVEVESPDSPRYKYQLNIGGKDSSVIKTLAPRREVGKNFLMQGEEMWAYIPNIRRSIRVTLNQKLTGQASNGDISRMRWFGDYHATISDEDENSWTLHLIASKKGLSYEKMNVSIEKKTFRPIRGEYLSMSGRPLKYIKFEEFGSIGGGIRPMKMKIVSADNPSDFSILKTISMKKVSLPRSMFTEAALKK